MRIVIKVILFLHVTIQVLCAQGDLNHLPTCEQASAQINNERKKGIEIYRLDSKDITIYDVPVFSLITYLFGAQASDIVGFFRELPEQSKPLQFRVRLENSFDEYRAEVFLIWRKEGEKEAQHIRMKEDIRTVQCKHTYISRRFLGFVNKTVTKVKSLRDISFVTEIPPQEKGTRIELSFRAKTFDESLEFPREGQTYNLPVVSGVWEDLTTWDRHPFLNFTEFKLPLSANLSKKEIQGSQVGFDGEYLYFRIKTKNAVTEGKCGDKKDKHVSMNAYGVVLLTPEYKPLEEEHVYLISGWVLAYAPCLNRIYGAREVAFYESSTFKKGPIRGSGAEYKFFAPNDLLLRIPYEKIQPNPSKKIGVLFLVGSTKDMKNPIAHFEPLDGAAALVSLEKYSFIVQ